jgi:hypothetical protein
MILSGTNLFSHVQLMQLVVLSLVAPHWLVLLHFVTMVLDCPMKLGQLTVPGRIVSPKNQ